MSYAKGKIEAIISLSPETCFFLKTGKCSLDRIGDYGFSEDAPMAPNDIMYCPLLCHRLMTSTHPLTAKVQPCECGHAEVIDGQQLVCIAGMKKIPVILTADSPEQAQPLCSVCQEDTAPGQDGIQKRIVTLYALVEQEPE